MDATKQKLTKYICVVCLESLTKTNENKTYIYHEHNGHCPFHNKIMCRIQANSQYLTRARFFTDVLPEFLRDIYETVQGGMEPTLADYDV